MNIVRPKIGNIKYLTRDHRCLIRKGHGCSMKTIQRCLSCPAGAASDKVPSDVIASVDIVEDVDRIGRAVAIDDIGSAGYAKRCGTGQGRRLRILDLDGENARINEINCVLGNAADLGEPPREQRA